MAILGGSVHIIVYTSNFAFPKATTHDNDNQPIVLRTVRGDCSMKDRRNNKIIRGGHHANKDQFMWGVPIQIIPGLCTLCKLMHNQDRL